MLPVVVEGTEVVCTVDCIVERLLAMEGSLDAAVIELPFIWFISSEI